MAYLNSSKLVVSAAVVGCLLTAGFAWRVLGGEPTEGAEGVEVIVPSVSVSARPSRYLPSKGTEMVGVVDMATLREQQARSARERTESLQTEVSGPEEPSPDDPGATESGSLELVIQLPPGDRVEGVALRAVLDEPTGGTASRDGLGQWKAEAQMKPGEESLVLDDLPPAKSFRLRLYLGDELYSTTTVQAGGPGRATIKIDFLAKHEQEQATIALLRSIAAAQQQLQASAAIDTDADGGGEFGYLAELAGTQPIRAYSAGGPTLDSGGIKLDPTYLPKSLGAVGPSSRGGAVVRGGYAFLVFLPDDSAESPISGIAEAPHGGNAVRLPGSANAERMWCCYAWPVEKTVPMKRAFMIHQERGVLGTVNDGPRPYVGLDAAPAFDAAFSVPGDMGSPLGLATAGLLSNDGRVWGAATH